MDKKESFSKKVIKLDRKVIIAIFCGLVVLIIVIFSVLGIINKIGLKDYEVYENKITTYGLNELYNNNNANTYEKITKLEALKLAIASMLNTNEISDYVQTQIDDKDEEFIEYAKDLGIISVEERNDFKKNSTITYSELVCYFEKALDMLSNVEISENIIDMLRNDTKYSDEVKLAISNLIEKNIIVVNSEKINGNKKAVKGMANELAVNILEKYIITANDSMKTENMPSNANEYPYILNSFSNEAYELSRIESLDSSNKQTPKEVYKLKKTEYERISRYVKNYFEAMLNVDYEVLDYSEYASSMDKYLIFSSKSDSLEQYFDYIIQNKIKMEANAQFVEPCVYYDGEHYRARVKIDLKILETDTRENLLIGDLNSESSYVYNKDEYTMYVDCALSSAINSNIMYIKSITNLRNICVNINDLDIVKLDVIKE